MERSRRIVVIGGAIDANNPSDQIRRRVSMPEQAVEKRVLDRHGAAIRAIKLLVGRSRDTMRHFGGAAEPVLFDNAMEGA